MKAKLFTLITMLLLGIGSMWAETIVVANNINKTTGPDTYGGLSNNIWTSKAASGIAGLKISTAGTIGWGNQNNIRGLWIQPTAENVATTVTITAPDGYYITGYKLIAESSGASRYFDVSANEGSGTTSFTGLVGTSSTKTIEVGGIRSSTATFDITCTSGGNYYIIFRGFFITLMPTSESANTYCISLGNGKTKRDGTTEKNDPINATWCNSYESSQTTPLINMSTSANIFCPIINGAYDMDTRNGTYTISTTSDNYVITGVKIVGTAQSTANSITYNGNTTNFAVGVANTVTISDLCTSSLSFSIGTNSKFYTKIYVTLAEAYDVTFVIKDGSATVSGGTAKHLKGSAPNLSNSKSTYKSSAVSEYPSYANGYCTYEYYSDASCTTPISQITSTCTVYAKVVSTSAPVEFASSIDDADAQWYTLKLRDYQFYVDGETVKLSSTDITSASAQWVFTGSVCNAYVYNKSAEKYLVMNNGACALSDTPQPWIIYPHQVEGFYLYYASDYKFPFRDSEGNLAYSDGPFNESANAASFMPTGIKTNYKEDVIANVQPFFTTGVGSYFGLKTTVKDEYEDDVTDATTACDADGYSALLAIVSNPSNFVYPESGYYRIKNYSTAYYLGKKGSAPTIEFANTDAASVLYLTRSGDEGSYKYTINMQGANYRNTGKSGATGNYSLAIVAPGRFTMNDCNNAVFGYLYASGTTLSQDDLKGDASCWTLEDAISFSAAITNANDNTGTGHSYATVCVPFAISSIDDASAYAPSIDGSSLDLGDALETPIAAGTPVILIGATGAGSYTANIKTDATPVASPTTTNALTGTFIGTSIDCTAATGTNYVLGFDKDNENRIGFYHVNSSSYNLKANRAYLSTSGENARGFYISFADDATGIDAPNGETAESAAIYNLSGQRLNKMQKGINIVNGKKVLF